jgi:hypothetical protein
LKTIGGRHLEHKENTLTTAHAGTRLGRVRVAAEVLGLGEMFEDVPSQNVFRLFPFVDLAAWLACAPTRECAAETFGAAPTTYHCGPNNPHHVRDATSRRAWQAANSADDQWSRPTTAPFDLEQSRHDAGKLTERVNLQALKEYRESGHYADLDAGSKAAVDKTITFYAAEGKPDGAVLWNIWAPSWLYFAQFG